MKFLWNEKYLIHCEDTNATEEQLGMKYCHPDLAKQFIKDVKLGDLLLLNGSDPREGFVVCINETEIKVIDNDPQIMDITGLN